MLSRVKWNVRGNAPLVGLRPVPPAVGNRNRQTDLASEGWPHHARRWFEALDQTPINVGATSWVAQVVGIYVDGPQLWIQIESGLNPMRSVVLHVTPATSLGEALAAIEANVSGALGPQIVDARRVRVVAGRDTLRSVQRPV